VQVVGTYLFGLQLYGIEQHRVPYFHRYLPTTLMRTVPTYLPDPFFGCKQKSVISDEGEQCAAQGHPGALHGATQAT
jgi:hypothetical protein